MSTLLGLGLEITQQRGAAGPTHGPNLITNGTFDADTDWTKEVGWAIAAGVADCDGSQGGNSKMSQVIPAPEAAVTYLVELDLTRNAGSFKNITVGGTTDTTAYTSTQAISTEIVATSADTEFKFVGNVSFIGTVDNVSVRKVL